MSTETTPPPIVEDNTDVEERLAALFAEEPAEGEEGDDYEPQLNAQAEGADDDAPKAEAKPDDEKDEKDEDFREVEFEGKEYKLPKEIAHVVGLQKEFTRKSQETARRVEATEDRGLYLQARENIISTAFEEMAHVHHLQSQIKEYDNIDWAGLIEQDHAQAMKLDMRRQQLRAQLSDAQQKLQASVQRSNQTFQEHVSRQWAIAVKGARERLGKVSDDDDMAALQQARALGFTDKEIQVKLADDRLLVALFKAAKWDALQAAKPEARKKAENAKPMKTPAARSTTGAVDGGKAAMLGKVLKKTGNPKAAEALLEQRFAQRYK